MRKLSPRLNGARVIRFSSQTVRQDGSLPPGYASDNALIRAGVFRSFNRLTNFLITDYQSATSKYIAAGWKSSCDVSDTARVLLENGVVTPEFRFEARRDTKGQKLALSAERCPRLAKDHVVDLVIDNGAAGPDVFVVFRKAPESSRQDDLNLAMAMRATVSGLDLNAAIGLVGYARHAETILDSDFYWSPGGTTPAQKWRSLCADLNHSARQVREATNLGIFAR